ncbi:hypothetical protein [Hymenobacter profundi]|uniref:Fibronectin type-III domain-containing protein n=1 Tax=Hymenobacter profundi TaxID=1982110 RepID=A0ABS6WY05_9BACT|nr:hypothetical protein [Hymenobacter profundi]MBW3128478.1 hypothetical protein [Hymenobacter profundi]
MPRLLPFFLLLLTLFACQKEDDADEPKSYSDKIVLQDLVLAGDSIKLTWSKLEDATLKEYRVVRREETNGPESILNRFYPPSGSSLATKFTDDAVPYVPTLEYQVVGVLTSGQMVNSNIVTHKRPEIKIINAVPFDVQFDSQRRVLYFFENDGKISQYDLAKSQVTKSIKTDATIGYCDFATYNGTPELYVPRNDGWIFIYNAETLDKIDQFNVGSPATCVVANHDLLFVAANNSSWPYRPVQVYSRASKTLVSQSTYYTSGNPRLKRIPNTDTELLSIGSSNQQYYSFSPKGDLLNQSQGYYSNYPLDANILELFPSSRKYLSSSSGVIYSISQGYEASLPKGNLAYTSFLIDAAERYIYAGTSTKSVEVYTNNNYVQTRSIKTKAYPYRLFQDGSNGLLCISSTTPSASIYYYNTPSKFVIEQLR